VYRYHPVCTTVTNMDLNELSRSSFQETGRNTYFG
jgi:hypothetical protein